MVSECCGAYSEYAGDIDICPDCKEHCEFYDDEEEDEDVKDTRWVILEEGRVHTALLTKDEAEVQKQIMQNKFPDLLYTLFYDEYYEYTEIINEN